ncbi:MAG: serine/threonine-protein kinase PknK [Myxococcota bacterium]|jgi:serine/threonine-protein kinase PknK
MEVLLDRYEVLARLGSGGLAEILRVADRAAVGRTVALKRQRVAGDDGALLAEFRALAQVQHPNLPAIYDYHADLGGRDGKGQPGYTLEEVVGRTADVVADELGPTCVPQIAAGLLRALAHIHGHGLIHGDIHPHNLLVRVPDSWSADSGTPLHVTVLDLSPGVPRSGGMGALPFLAPERLEGGPPSIAADLFSVGVTLYRLMSGGLPFPDYPHMPKNGVPVGLATLGPGAKLIGELLSIRPGSRPTRASSVLARLGEALGAPLAPLVADDIRSALLHGPSQAIGDWPGQLVSAAQDDLLARNTSGVIVVSGALGSGRSRSLRELRWTLQGAATTLVLHTTAAAGDPPAGTIRRLMTQVPPAMRAALDSDLSDLIEAMVSEGPPAPDADRDPKKSRDLLVDQLTRAVAALGRARPLAVLVDDVDRADELSAAVLGSLARYASYRPTEVESLALVLAGSAGETLTGIVQSADRLVEFHPPAFDATAVAGLARGTFAGRTPSHRLVEAVTAATGGNPLVTCEALAAAFRAGWLAVTDDSVDMDASCPSPLPVPGSAVDALVARLEGVTSEAWVLLGLLAHTPIPIPAALVGPALDLDEAAVGPLLDRLGSDNVIVQELEGSQLRLSLAAPALRDAVVERVLDLEPVWERLAELNLSRSDLASQIVAAHAGRRIGNDPALAILIGKKLVERGMARETIGLLKDVEAPEAAGVLGDAYAQVGQDDDALAAYRRLDAREGARRRGILLQRRGRFDEAIARLTQALGSSPDVDAQTHTWIARACMLQSRYDDALSHCVKARGAATSNLQPRLDWIEGLVNFYRGHYAESESAFEQALDRWRETGHLVEQADVINALGLIHYRQSDLATALNRFHEALGLAARSGDRDRALLTLMNVAVIHQARGEWSLAESRYHEALKTAHLLGHRSGGMKVTQNLGNLYRYLGELDRAAEYLEQSLGQAVAESNAYIEAHNRCLIGEVAWLQGDDSRAIAEIQKALTAFESVGSVGEAADCQRSLAQVYVARGELGLARKMAEAALRRGAEVGLPRVEALANTTLAAVARLEGRDLRAWLDTLSDARNKMRELARPDELWQIGLELHRLNRDLGRADDAKEAGVAALAALDELAGRLQETRRETFLAARDRRTAVRELRWLESLGSGSSRPSEGRLTRLLDVNQRLTQELELPKLLEYLIDSAILLTGAERGFVLMLDPTVKEPDNLKVVVARNIDQENIRNKRYKVSYSIAQRVIEAGEAVLTTDAMGDDRYNEYLSIHHLKLRSVLCLPMSRAGRVLGALYIDNRFQKNAFTDDDLQFMEAFANQAAIALANAQIMSERKEAVEELAKSQAKVEELNSQLRAQLAEKERALEETEQMLVVQRKQLTSAHSYDSIVGDSGPLRSVFHVLDRVCESEIPVLVTGESGTGKELVARAIHYNGVRKNRAFVAINCSSIPETLIESELFGHTRGAFTGATADKKGVFEVASRGTLFLDEIGEMPVEMQAKLLRALQEGEIQKVGSPRTVKVDVRVVAATNRNLAEMIAQKQFREDLYYRLAVVTIALPSLRERIEDVPLLVQHFLEKNRADGLGAIDAISAESMRLLMRYNWPGNVRELETVIKNASIFAEGSILQPQDFSNFPNIVGTNGDLPLPPSTNTVRRLDELEREAIIHGLEVNSGNKKKTAEQLGIDRRTLYNKLAAYGISVERRAHVRGRD